jgi:hypothetical protein
MEEDFFIVSGMHDCEECGEGVYAEDPKGVPVVFDLECEEHGDRQVIFHESCLPDEFRAAYKAVQMRQAAPLN